MKKDIHPKYQKILFVDSSTGHKFVCGSTLQPKQMDKFEGTEYPVYHLSTSSASHPFFTGSKALVDSEGRVDKFKKRYATAQSKVNNEEPEGKLEEQPKEKEAKKDSKKKKK
ncbi:50S ribosomal protein L31 type B [Neochlamydia sp. TUME1]|jgi:large subunit ribosomal protein L31|uniref:type B 50S ribosomal protein L31 n=1 Tax=unclassified Neochlamydia TaxID=2643326 RepID=UPI00057C3AC1|nr:MULTISPECIES: type B 50S ribosomal protein L31 [unclassified Neochlamydia]KIC75796.1 50S ribosomal protein L31 type B [Neochlamydia sp. TUME1]BBI16812.1 50S ribosomal protein L31 [Neochlamydia sp. S13]